MNGAEQLYDQFANIPALEAQKAKIIEMFADVKSGIIEMNKLGGGVEAADSMKKLTSSTNEFGAAQRAVNSLLKQTSDTEAKLQILRTQEYAQLSANKIVNQEQNKDLQLRLKLQHAEEGSVNQLSLQYEKATRIINRLTGEQRESTKGQALIKYASDLQVKLKELDGQVGSFRRNVGNYAESLAGGFNRVAQEIEKLKQKQSGLQTNVQDLTTKRTQVGFSGKEFGPQDQAELASYNTQLNEVTGSIEQLEKVQAIGFNSNLNYSQSVKQIEKSYQDMVVSGKFSEDFLNAFKKFAAEAKDQAEDLRNEIKALSSDTHGLDLGVEAVKNIATGFEIAASASTLFGDKSEKTQKEVEESIRRLIAVQTIANGIRELGEQITRKGTIANKAYNVVLKISKTLFDEDATAAARFAAVLKGIGVVALVIGVIKLVEVLSQMGKEEKNAQENLADLNVEMERANRLNDEVIEKLERRGEIIAAVLKSRKFTEEQISQAIQKNYDDEADAFDNKAKSMIGTLNNLRSEASRNLDDADRVVNFDFLNNKITDLTTAVKFLDNLDLFKLSKSFKNLSEEGKADFENLETSLNSVIDSFKKANNIRDKASDDVLKAQLDKQRKYADDEKKAALDLLKFRQGLIIEQKNFEQSNDSFLSLNKKTEAAKASAKAQRTIVIAQQQFDLSQENLTSSQITLINEEKANNIYKINLSLYNRLDNLRQIEKQRIKDDADAEIADYFKQQDDKFNGKKDADNKLFEKENNTAEKIFNESLQKAAEQYQKEISVKDLTEKDKIKIQNKYEQQKVQAENIYNQTILYNQIEFYQKQIDLLKSFGQDTSEAEAELAKARADIATLGNEPIDKSLDIQKDKVESLNEKWKELSKTIGETFYAVIQGTFDAQKNNIQDQIDDIDRLKEAELDRINSTTDADETKAAKIKIVESKAQSDKEALERRQRNLDRQKAIYEKAYKGFQIVSDTKKSVAGITLAAAEAYAKTLATIPPPIGTPIAAAAKAQILSQIPFVLATSAANLIALLATPIPKYYTGTDYSIGGKARVAERGREMFIDPQGKLGMFNREATVNLQEGTKIFNNRVTEDIIRSSTQEIVNLSPEQQTQIYENHVEDLLIEMIDEIRSMRKNQRILIQNNTPIETTVWFDKYIKN